MKCFITIFMFLCFCTFSGLAKQAGTISGNGHSGDIAKVLGIDVTNQRSMSKMTPVVEVFAKMIDAGTDKLLSDIKKIEPNFSWGNYSHRLFFHWGFNSDPRMSVALKGKIEQATDDSNKQEQIYQIILEYQAVRNREMMKSVETLGPLVRDEVNAISTIIYDTHILGDYIDGSLSTQRVLLPLRELIADIIRASRKLESNNPKLLNLFKDELNIAVNTAGDDSTKAQAILNVMISRVPELIKSTNRVNKAINAQ